jgi:predicted DNA-binding ribbon-helix-helix protein
MSGRPRKHSLTLRGHRTSVSLEDDFWAELQRLAAAEDISVNELITRIDAARGVSAGLASAIRVHVLAALKAGR